jgi:transposase
LSRTQEGEKEPDLGLFSLRVRISLSEGSPTREKEGLYPHPPSISPGMQSKIFDTGKVMKIPETGSIVRIY